MDPIQEKLAAAEAEAERLRQQVDALTIERDELKKLYLGELARQATEPSQSELAAAIPHGPWFDEFLARLQRGDPNAMDSWPKG